MMAKTEAKAEVELNAGPEEFAATVQWFMALGWVVTTVFPADSPRRTTLKAYGINISINKIVLPESTSGGTPCTPSTESSRIAVQCPNGKDDLPVVAPAVDGDDDSGGGGGGGGCAVLSVVFGAENEAPNGTTVIFVDTSNVS